MTTPQSSDIKTLTPYEKGLMKYVPVDIQSRYGCDSSLTNVQFQPTVWESAYTEPYDGQNILIAHHG